MTSPADDLADDAWLEERLAQALSTIESGSDLDLLALCGERPHLMATLAAALGLRNALPALRPPAEPALAGQLLGGRYRLLQSIGRGAAGIVYRAHDESLRRDVAVKLVHAGLLGGVDAAARFAREARALAQQAHSHVVRVYDHGAMPDGRQYLVTELLQGQSLQAILAAAQAAMPSGPSAAAFGSAPWLEAMLPDAGLDPSYLRQVVRWTIQLGEGLGHAHHAGIYHRDVKPSNAFVRADGSAVLLDFGIAVRAGDPAVTLEHAIVGTPCYMAPEQAQGRVEPHATLDVYGLAATLYHLLTLRPPHQGDFATVLHAVRTVDPTPASWLHQGLPADLQAILDHGLERQPQRRYRTIGELVADLRAFLEHRPVGVRPLSGLQRMLRRARAQPARTLAVLGALAFAITLAVAVPALAALETIDAHRERSELMAQLPGDLSIEGWPDQRLLVPRSERNAGLATLDRLVELDPNDIAVRFLRAAERIDAGDVAAAGHDLAAIAATPYLREVAARYAKADPGKRGLSAIDLSGLPEPAADQDSFVAGFHALRARDSERAVDLLNRAEGFLPARELRLLALLGLKQPDPERIIAEAGWLEGTLGRPTARTQHALGAAMLMRKQYEKAIQHCEESLRLHHDRHGPLNNLGLAHLRLGHYPLARSCYERAVAQRPWFANSLSGLSQTLRALGDWDQARATAARIEDVCWREHELGNIDVAAAIGALAAGDEGQRQQLTRAAAAHFAAATSAAGTTTNPRAGSLPAMAAYAAELATEDVVGLLPDYLDQLRSDPRNPQQLANLAGVLRGVTLDQPARDALRLFLLDLAVDLAPDHAVIRAGRDDLRRELHRTPPPK